MGKLKNGIFGSITGKVGNLVIYKSKGQDIVRTIGRSGKPFSKKQQANHQRMRVVNDFLGGLNRFIDIGFELEVAGTTSNAYNGAVAYNFKHALQGEFPEISVDYSKALLSKGDLPAALNTTIVKTADGIEVTWESPEALSANREEDQVMLLVYLPEEKNSVCKLSNVLRPAGKDSIPLHESILNQQLEVYISFRSDDRKAISDSVYCGSL